MSRCARCVRAAWHAWCQRARVGCCAARCSRLFSNSPDVQVLALSIFGSYLNQRIVLSVAELATMSGRSSPSMSPTTTEVAPGALSVTMIDSYPLPTPLERNQRILPSPPEVAAMSGGLR